jgi:hypothetical protein
MGTPRMRWPDHAEDARIFAIANARRGREIVQAIYHDPRMTNSPDILRTAAAADDLFTAIILELQTVGPQAEREQANQSQKTIPERVFA